MRTRTSALFFWTGLGVITLLYALYYLLFLYDVFITMPLHGRHLVKFLFIVLAFLAGNYCMKRYAPAWMLRTWRVIYIVGLGLLLLLGCYDWLVMRVPLTIRGVADDVQELLVSPLVYIGINILARVLV
jgi:hypothetical protein